MLALIGPVTKPLMLLDVMHDTALTADWVMWTDDDVYFNSGWLGRSLDMFLENVPPDKVRVNCLRSETQSVKSVFASNRPLPCCPRYSSWETIDLHSRMCFSSGILWRVDF